MDLFSLLVVAVGLAMDAFSAAVTDGMVLKERMSLKGAVKIAAFFGVFQCVMTFAGYLLGYKFKDYIQSVDHWVALVLLSIVGGRMLYEGIKRDEEKHEIVTEMQNPLDNRLLTLLAAATSIDALAVGITLATMSGMPILFASGIIGVVAFVMSICGVYIGNKFGDLFGNKADIAGGLVLVGIGVKILIEHLFFM